ncbi:MAG: hypothetical protein JXA68_02085 [Ignavibacteriales bacterium]|nr:hypothetical protein [Ignavibacteriales bacterium]
MKKVILVVIFFLFTSYLFSNVNCSSSNQIQEEKIKNMVTKFLDYCDIKDYESAGKYLLYNGENANRKYKEIFNYSNTDEKKEVERICKKVNAMLIISDSYTNGSITQETKEGITWQVLEVFFKSGEQVLRQTFYILEIANNYYIGIIK